MDRASGEGSAAGSTALELLATAWERAAEGSPQIVTITGNDDESARVIERFVTDRGVRSVGGTFNALTPALGLGPLPDIVMWLSDESPLDEALAGEPPWVRAALDDVLGRADEPRELGEIYAAVQLLIDTSHAPLVLVLRDVHFAGHALLNLVAFLSTRTTRHAVLVVCTAPEGFVAHAQWPDSDVVRLPPGTSSGAEIDAHGSDPEWARSLEETFEGRTHPELVGAHFERAGLREEAAAWLGRAGRLAFQRADMPAAADLLIRAARLLPAGNGDRLEALATACDAFLSIGRPDRAVDVAVAAKQEAEAAGDDCMRARFTTWVALMGPPADERSLADELDAIARTLDGCPDDVGRAQAYEARAQLLWDEGESSGGLELMEVALFHARAGRDRPTTSRMVAWLLDRSLAGPEPLPETLARVARFGWIAEWSALLDVKRRLVTAAANAAAGIPAARDELDAAVALQSRLGQPGWVARAPQVAAWIDLLEDDPQRAERHIRPVYDELVAQGHPVAVESGVLLARALVKQGSYQEAALVAVGCEGIPSPPSDDGMDEGEVAAVLCAANARPAPHEQTDLDAVVRALPPARVPVRRADALLDVADAAATLGQNDLARRLCEEAIGLYEAKQATSCAARARKALAVFGRQV